MAPGPGNESERGALIHNLPFGRGRPRGWPIPRDLRPEKARKALGTADFRRRRIISEVVLMRRLLLLDHMLGHRHPPWFPTESRKVAAFKNPQIRRRVLLQRRREFEPCDTRETDP